MSEKSQDTQEKTKSIVISPDDCRVALDFWTHFNIPVPQNLADAVDSFAKDSTLENQDKVKLEICKAIAAAEHEAFKDEMFLKIVDECISVTYEMQFDKDLEDTLTEDK